MKVEVLRIRTTQLQFSHKTKSMVPGFLAELSDNQFGHCEGQAWNKWASYGWVHVFQSFETYHIAI